MINSKYTKITPTQFLSACITNETNSLILKPEVKQVMIMEAHHYHNSQCLCLSLQMKLMTSEYLDCSISLRHTTGFLVLGAVTSQSLASLFLLFYLPQLASVFTHSSNIFLCLPQQKIHQEVNRLISVPPSWDCPGQQKQLDGATSALKDSLCKWKMMKISLTVLERPRRHNSPHTVLENGVSSASQRWAGSPVGHGHCRFEKTIKAYTQVTLESIPQHSHLEKTVLWTVLQCARQYKEPLPCSWERDEPTPHLPITKQPSWPVVSGSEDPCSQKQVISSAWKGAQF